MTPLEELQAAHDRLSELRNAQSPTDGWWTWDEKLPDTAKGEIWADYPNEDEARDIGEMYRMQDADLIVTLHRTIDVQLAMLAAAIEVHQTIEWADFGDIPNHLALARAINGDKQ